jgi:hypothetical protein
MSKSASSNDIEFYPDAMQHFERAVKVVAKSPPQHRVAKKLRQRKRLRKNEPAEAGLISGLFFKFFDLFRVSF